MRCLISGLIVSLVLVWGSSSLAQCLPTMASPAPSGAPTTAVAPASASAPTGALPASPTAALRRQGDQRRSQNSFGGISPGDAYLQSLASMSPMGMVADLGTQQAAMVAQQQRGRPYDERCASRLERGCGQKTQRTTTTPASTPSTLATTPRRRVLSPRRQDRWWAVQPGRSRSACCTVELRHSHKTFWRPSVDARGSVGRPATARGWETGHSAWLGERPQRAGWENGHSAVLLECLTGQRQV